MAVKKVELSIIIPSFNTKLITSNCLDSIYTSLQHSPLEYEVIVVDNASSDGSVSMLQAWEKKDSHIKLLLNKENVGYGKANNRAIERSEGSYTLLLNSDIIVLDNAIEALFEFYRQHERNMHFVGGKLLNEDLSAQTSCGPFYSLPVAFAALLLKGDYYGLTRYSPDKIKEVGWVSGACIMTKKEHYEKLNGFDEGIFMYMEEIDLLYRAHTLGMKIFFYPEARFIHLGSASSKSTHKRTFPILQVYRGYLYLYKKHFGPRSMFLLKSMLKLKSFIAIIIGRLTNNRYLIETYEEANKLVAEA